MIKLKKALIIASVIAAASVGIQAFAANNADIIQGKIKSSDHLMSRQIMCFYAEVYNNSNETRTVYIPGSATPSYILFPGESDPIRSSSCYGSINIEILDSFGNVLYSGPLMNGEQLSTDSSGPFKKKK